MIKKTIVIGQVSHRDDLTKETAEELEKRKQMQNKTKQDFLRGIVVENPPVNAGDTGLIPGPGRSHTPRATKPVSKA